MTKVQLPPGNYGLDMADGTRYTAKPGGTVDVEDRHAKAISKSQHAGIGLLSGKGGNFRLATKNGRHCPNCGFSAQCWSATCPRCAARTVPDSDSGPDETESH